MTAMRWEVMGVKRKKDSHGLLKEKDNTKACFFFSFCLIFSFHVNRHQDPPCFLAIATPEPGSLAGMLLVPGGLTVDSN